MSKKKMEMARALIQKKRYSEARRILKTVNHPTARKWLARLDQIAPERKARKGRKRHAVRDRVIRAILPRWGRGRLYWAAFAAAAILVLYACSIVGQFFGIIPTSAERNFTRTAEAVERRAALAATEDSKQATATASAQIAQATVDAQNTIIALTPPTPTFTLTHTLVPSATFTPSPSATITDTPPATFTPPPPPPTDAPPQIYYTVRTANVRACASTDCEQLAQLSAGTSVRVVGWIQGETYAGSDIWQRILYEGRDGYIHSTLLSTAPPQPTSQPAQVVPVSTIPPVSQPQWVCDCSRTCTRDITTCEEAYFQLNCGCSERDDDHDGVPCENLCPGG